MKTFFKWLGIVVGSLLALVVIAFFVLAFIGNSRITQTYDVSAENVVIPTDADSIARGEHWVNAVCIGCHKADLSGDAAFFDAPFAHIPSKNLTSGEGGAGAEFTDADWVRAIRHGVNPENSSLLVMPSPNFWYFSDKDLGDIIAYVKSVPPVDNDTGEPSFNLLGKAMVGAGMLEGLLPAEGIQQSSRPDFPPVGITADYGAYLVNVSGCHDCHGTALAGGKSPDPSAMNAPNLTPGGDLATWQDTDFVNTIRTGITPSGRVLNPVQMPWEHYMNYSDDELKTIFLYLQTLPKTDTVIP